MIESLVAARRYERRNGQSNQIRGGIVMPADDSTKTCRYCGETKPIPEFHSSRGRVWHQCKKCYYAKVTEWHRTNRQRSTEIKRASRARRREQETEAAHAKYWKDHAQTRKHRNAYQRMRRAANPDLTRAENAKRRGKRSGSEHYSAEDVAELMKRQNRKCAEPSCRASIRRKYHVDHIMPLALGGDNSKNNIQLLCPTCNVRKNAIHPDEWARRHGRLF